MPSPHPILPAARWIWPRSLFHDLHNSYALFRHQVELSDVPETAPTLITADQSYRLYVNGKYVCRGPARGYQRSWPCDEIDLAPWLRPGINHIAIQAYNPGFSTFQYVSEGFAGLLFMGDWGGVKVISDSHWKCRLQAGMKRDTVPSSLQLFPQEHIDAQCEPDNWTIPEFDASGENWAAPATSSAWNSEPWPHLETRGIPLLREQNLEPKKLLSIQQSPAASGAQDPGLRNVVELARRENLWHRSNAHTENDCRSPETVTSYFYDWNHTVVGCLRLEIENASGGEIVDALFAETIEEKDDMIAPRLDQPEVSLGSRLICRKGTFEHLFYHPYGFRYLVLRVRNAHSVIRIIPSIQTIGYPLQIQGDLRSSDARINRIWKACRHTQEICSLDAYVDTPWREQAQWWGDARVQAWNTFHLDNDPRLLQRGIRSIAGQTTSNGLTYGHAPTKAHHCILPDFTVIWMLTLWDDYWQTASLETFRDPLVQKTLQNALKYFDRHTDEKSGLVKDDPRHWLFLDWAPLQRPATPTILNLWLLLGLKKLSILFDLNHDSEQRDRCLEWSEKLSLALLALKDPTDGLYFDGLDAMEEPVSLKSVHAQTLAILAQLDTVEFTKNAMDRALLPFIRGESTELVGPSVYWCTYAFSALHEAGYGADVLDYILRHWTKMADHGTTWSQNMPYGSEQSHSHAWSAHPLYHLMQILGGIRQIESAWDSILFRPLFWGEFSSIRIPTPHGLLKSLWQQTSEDCIEVSLTVPEGVRARIELPSMKPFSVCQGTWEWTAKGSPKSKECAHLAR
ncbi:alpha-L-rhamnosidase-related protein [Puniceicoccus vermicola]|uniref:Alpha-L-rhamnosidase n=1 Tax=Puniceicoccus vermicola TaxID=388746 RepID=A0A7X1E6J6_9BACT|nr:alpha-L-rhamnosidase C-terminal domain-containing protein [Puniceicoccus vermicola]MBC2602752.1 alpha-L-rhamnosidase [Puniceicoccus vermicola]